MNEELYMKNLFLSKLPILISALFFMNTLPYRSISGTLLLAILSTGCGGILGTTPTYAPARTDAITPIQPFQSEDTHLSCPELNKEIGKLNERVSRLIEQNEFAESRKDETSPYLGAFYSAVVAVKRKISNAQEEPYGNDTGHLIQSYQERIEHLEKLSKSKGC